MWSSAGQGTDMQAPPHARPPATAEEEASSAFSQDDGSSEDETTRTSLTEGPRKRRKQKHQKISCEMCKTRKVKCDRAEPACSWCARHNRTCVYLERQKPGSRTGFNPELEAKVNRIDALLQALGRRVEDHIVHDHSRLGVSQAPSPTITSRNSPPNESFQQDRNRLSPGSLSRSSALPPVRTPGFPTPNSAGQGENALDKVHNGGEQAAQTPFGSSHSRADPFNLANSSISFSGPRKDSSLQPYMTDLPPQDVVYTLVDLYFKHCNTWCPILDRKTTFGIFFGSTSLNESDRILLYAIVATTLRFSKDTRLTPEMRAHYHASSKHAVQIYAMENISIPALRALVIITLDELGTSNGPRGWNLLSLLAQNVRQLDLCQETSVYLTAEAEDAPSTGSIRRIAIQEPRSWIEDEGRRRLCWMVYLLDRYATIATTTFDFMLDDAKMSRVLPCSYDLFSRNVPVETRSLHNTQQSHQPNSYGINRPENLGSFSYHCEILTILSKVHNFLKSPIDVTSTSDTAEWRNTYRSLDRALDGWLQSLPSEYSRISALCHSDPASRVANWFMLHSAYVTSVVRLHSSAAYPTIRSQIFVPSHYSMQRCLSAVQSLADITRDVLEANGLDLLGPPFAFSLWVGARLLLVHAATVGGPVDPKIDFFVETLRDIGQHWEVARNYAKILVRVVQRVRQSQASLSSMRRSAHDLVTLTAATRRSGLEQTSTQVTSLSELDNIDVFDFFNYPKILDVSAISSRENVHLVRFQSMNEVGAEQARPTGVPDPEADWLAFGTPFSQVT